MAFGSLGLLHLVYTGYGTEYGCRVSLNKVFSSTYTFVHGCHTLSCSTRLQHVVRGTCTAGASKRCAGMLPSELLLQDACKFTNTGTNTQPLQVPLLQVMTQNRGASIRWRRHGNASTNATIVPMNEAAAAAPL